MPRGGNQRGINHVPVADRRAWRECCCATDQHRFDCEEQPERFKRSGGPFLPLKAAP